MFDTNDLYDDAVRGSILDIREESTFKYSKSFKLLSVFLVVIITYIGLEFYTTRVLDNALVVRNETIAQIQEKSERIATLSIPPESQVYDEDLEEEEYLRALEEMESELMYEKVNVKLDTSSQMDLSLAMSDLMNDADFTDSSTYTKELRREIGVDESKEEHVVVKEENALKGIPTEVSRNVMNYKRMIASNDSIMHADSTIYVGQTIYLPQ